MRRILLLGLTLIAVMIPRSTLGQSAITSEIAPSGKLRVATNGGSTILVTQTTDGQVTGGVAVEVGRFIAEKLGVPFELVSLPNADAYVQSFGKGEWDIAIGASTPLVAEKAHFGPVLMFVDFMYVAAPGREFTNSAQVDQSGVKIGVGRNSSSDQFRSRALKSAELVRFTGGAGGGLEALRNGKVDIWAASASNVQGIAADLTGAKILPEAFTNEPYTVALAKGRSSAAQHKLTEIVSEAKKSGVVRKAVEKLNMAGVRAAAD